MRVPDYSPGVWGCKSKDAHAHTHTHKCRSDEIGREKETSGSIGPSRFSSLPGRTFGKADPLPRAASFRLLALSEQPAESSTAQGHRLRSTRREILRVSFPRLPRRGEPPASWQIRRAPPSRWSSGLAPERPAFPSLPATCSLSSPHRSGEREFFPFVLSVNPAFRPGLSSAPNAALRQQVWAELQRNREARRTAWRTNHRLPPLLWAKFWPLLMEP